MSAPRTDLDKQTRRHKAPLIGMAAGALIAVLLIGYWIMSEMAGTSQPDDAVPPPAAVETAPTANTPPSPGAPQQGAGDAGSTAPTPADPGAQTNAP